MKRAAFFVKPEIKKVTQNRSALPFRKRDKTATQVTRRQNAEFISERSRRASAVKYGHDCRDVKRKFLEAAEHHVASGSAAYCDNFFHPVRSLPSFVHISVLGITFRLPFGLNRARRENYNKIFSQVSFTG